ncbi:MAG: class I SAM-dependent methyltransferase [Candidatus Rokubacteria bacterium]|nr:class I SAM-dependent methyltransferase [Candidatus Rokubacteria bacterium]
MSGSPPAALLEQHQRLAPALAGLREAEPWPHFFDLRLSEWEIVLRLAGPAMRPGRWLDVGSGNSASTLLLSAEGYWTVGLDLPARDLATHTYGAELHAAVWKGVGRRVPVVWGTATDLPFRGETFDGVFSSYAIQYLADIDRGLREIFRVLKPGGTAVLVVPSAGQRVGAFSSMWREIAREGLSRVLCRRARPPRPAPADGSPPVTGGGLWSQLRRRFPDFPLPNPDSAHRSYLRELLDSRLAAWRRRARRAGFAVELAGTTSVTLRAVTEWVVSPWRAHRALRRLQILVQSGPLRRLVTHLGESHLLVLAKGAA